MPRTSEMVESKFIKKSDIGIGQLWTIKNVGKVNVAKDDEPEQHKWALFFEEIEKPMTLNTTNITICEKVFGSDDTDVWIGKQIVVYYDETIQYMGEVKGGIRVRAPKSQAEVSLPF